MTSPTSLIDARTGIVTSLLPRDVPAWFPASFSLLHARLSDTRAFSLWPSDSAGAGYAFADDDAVLGAAVGEAVERYCGNLVADGLVRDSWEGLTARGIHAVDPERLALFSSEQHTVGLPVAPFTRDTAVDWAAGMTVAGRSPVLVPASLVWVSHSLSRRPLLHPVIQAGLATGRTRDEALWGGLCEVIERDAMTIAWTGGGGMIDLTVPSWLTDFAQGPHGALEVRWLRFPHESGLPVIGALVADRNTGYLTLGMGVGPDRVAAAIKAYGEGLQLQLFSADLDDEHGPYMAAAAAPASPLQRWRADREYSRSYDADLRDVIDYGCHLQLHLDPAIQQRFLDELDASVIGHESLDEYKDLPVPRDVATLDQSLRDRGLDPVFVDVTTADIAPSGLHVVRVTVPGTYSNAPHALPFLGGSRLPSPRIRPVPLPH